jgi:hypothetical protein
LRGCPRFLLRRKFVPYLEGTLPAREARRLERHLGTCKRCRILFERARDGHELARELQQLNPKSSGRAPGNGPMTLDAGKQASGWRKGVRVWENGLYALMTTRGVQILIVLVVVLAAFLVISNWQKIFREPNDLRVSSTALALSDFRPVAISEIKSNTQPHVVIEGYVRNVNVDKQEGTLHFRLTESPKAAEPFVVCEILSSSGMTLPREGSRVRVYGVARFDGQPGRMWYEVNPVLNIALLKR